MSMESIGRPVAPSSGISEAQYRGVPMYSKAEMRKMFPLIHVDALPPSIRRAKPHEFRCTMSGIEERKHCNLCYEELSHAIHHF